MRNLDFLKDKSERFFRVATELYNRREFDLAAFNLEQSAQLFLKYILFVKLGDYTKTHSLFELLRDVKNAYNKENEVEDFISKHREVIRDLEISYIESRYFYVEFPEEKVEKMMKFVSELKQFLMQL